MPGIANITFMSWSSNHSPNLQKESGTGTWAIITNKETKSEEDLRQYYDSRSKKIDHEQFSRLMTFNQKTEFSGSFFDEKDVLTLTSILLSISEVRSITRLRQSKFLFDEISQNPIYIYSSSFNFDSYSIYPITESEVLGVRAKLEMRGTKSISSSFRFFLESRQHRIDNFKSFLFAFLALEELGKQSYTKGWKISGGKTQGYAHMFRQLVCSQSLEEEHKVFLSDHKIVDGVFWKEDHKLEETWYKKKAGERGDQGFFKISSPRTRIGIMMLILNNEEFEKFQTDFLVFKNLNRVRNNLVHQNLFQPKNENCQSISRLFMDYARRHVDFLGKYDES